MLVDIDAAREWVDLECLAEHDTAVAYALAKPAYNLLRAVTVRACLDLVALRNPRAACHYLASWKHADRGAGASLEMPQWIALQRRQVESYLSDGGGDLAIAVDCYDLVQKAMRPRKRIWDSVRRHMGA